MMIDGTKESRRAILRVEQPDRGRREWIVRGIVCALSWVVDEGSVEERLLLRFFVVARWAALGLE